jgi:arylsulfatase A-like enzyme
MVSAMDESLARIRAKLEELNIADNTIIIFTSDNGGMSASILIWRQNAATPWLALTRCLFAASFCKRVV